MLREVKPCGHIGSSCVFKGPWSNKIKTINISTFGLFLCFHITAFLCRRRPPLGPMPNEDIDVRNLDTVEKYRSYNRYFTRAEEAKSKPTWWKTYQGWMENEDPEHGEK